MLKEKPRTDSFHVFDCIGYFEDHSDTRLGLRFAFPTTTTSRETRPQCHFSKPSHPIPKISLTSASASALRTFWLSHFTHYTRPDSYIKKYPPITSSSCKRGRSQCRTVISSALCPSRIRISRALHHHDPITVTKSRQKALLTGKWHSTATPTCKASRAEM